MAGLSAVARRDGSSTDAPLLPSGMTRPSKLMTPVAAAAAKPAIAGEGGLLGELGWLAGGTPPADGIPTCCCIGLALVVPAGVHAHAHTTSFILRVLAVLRTQHAMHVRPHESPASTRTKCQQLYPTHATLQALQQLILLLALDEVPLRGHEVALPQQLVSQGVISLVATQGPVQLVARKGGGVCLTAQALIQLVQGLRRRGGLLLLVQGVQGCKAVAVEPEATAGAVRFWSGCALILQHCQAERICRLTCWAAAAVLLLAPRMCWG